MPHDAACSRSSGSQYPLSSPAISRLNPSGGVGEAARRRSSPGRRNSTRCPGSWGRHARAEEGVGGLSEAPDLVAERAELAREPGQRSVEDEGRAAGDVRGRRARGSARSRGTPGTRRARPGDDGADRPRRGAPGASRAGPTARTAPRRLRERAGRRTRLSRQRAAHDAVGEARGRGERNALTPAPVVAERAERGGDERRERGGDEERREASAGRRHGGAGAGSEDGGEGCAGRGGGGRRRSSAREPE